MEIRFQIKGRVFSICFGHKTHWFRQMSFLVITELWFNKELEVYYAKMLFNTKKRGKNRKNT